MLGHASVMSQRLGCVPAEMEHLTAYIERLLARPAFQKALALE
jgi:glutathione S-transferase